MQKKLAQLKETLATLADLNGAQGVLGWDQQTYMPPLAAEARGQQLGTLGKIAHDIATAPELGRLLDELKVYAADLDPDSDDARLIKYAIRDFEQSTLIPGDFVVEQAQAIALASQAWIEAKQESNFPHFQPHLEKIIDLAHRLVGFFPPAEHPYDTLLDFYEPGMKTADVRDIFNPLRTQQVELIRKISQKQQVDDSFLHQPFDEKKQWDFGVEVVTKFGYDWQRGRQDKVAHPFTSSFSQNDVRITTRINPDFLNTMLFSTMHEAGHALYDLGYAPELERTNLNNGASQGIHESQSRLWENLVGRSLPFWQHFYPRLKEYFPQLEKVSLDQFYKGINKTQPSLVRVEADEATYNLHIMLRLELEIAIIEGKVQVKDLPMEWNKRMEEYLGVTPPDDARGVLQDVHWSWGYIGYFPTYALGNLVSAQLWEKITGEIPDLDEQISQGRFESLLEWLRKNVHRHGRKFLPQELVQKITGTKIDSAPYIRYLTGKFSQIYDL